MKRFAVIVALAIAVGLLLVPQAGNAVNCQNATPQPTPQSGSMTQSLAPADPAGVAWVHGSGSQAGAKGGHGYIVVQQNGSSATVYGRQNESGLNGRAHVDSVNPSTVCIDLSGN